LGEFTATSVDNGGGGGGGGRCSGGGEEDDPQTMVGLQESGDVMYVPEYWSHTTVNQGESIGMAFEFY
jgi:hypothetical protein